MERNVRFAAVAAALAALTQPGSAATSPKMPDPATLQLPDLNVALTDEDRAAGDKYFFFHRADTIYEQALRDIRQCDDLARGVKTQQNWVDAPYPYAGTLAGAGGAVIGNMVVALIFASAEERKMRRANMRRCMNYKAYDRYALPKDTWTQFNFEEALKSIPNEERLVMLAQQAKAASGPKPPSGVLGK